VSCVGCNEVQERHFDSLNAANQQHMVEKGLIPAFTPPDARDINVEGDLALASVYGSYTSADTALLRKRCSPAEDSLRIPGYGAKWFRDDLKKSESAAQVRFQGYEVFRCEDRGFNVAILGSRNIVYFWSVRK
jgi:hypothetical protein